MGLVWGTGGGKRLLLCIDDSVSQLALYRQQIEPWADVQVASSYEEAMAILSSVCPDLVILDLVMPQVDGFEFLSILKSTRRFESTPVIMVSSENDPQQVRKAFVMGAADFVRKPYDGEELRLRVTRLLDLAPDRSADRVSEPGLSITAQGLMVEALMDLSRTRDNETGLHLVRIEKYVNLLASAASKVPAFRKSLPDDLLETIGELSVLHDIGKVGIPDAILMKPGPLTPQEFEIMKTHTTIGDATIRQIEKRFSRYPFLSWAGQIVRHHHERWDGTGYPDGCAGEAIPLSARIVAIADVFDALTTPRVYKKAFSFDEALKTMSFSRGEQFDPSLFDVFLGCVGSFHRVLDEYPTSRD